MWKNKRFVVLFADCPPNGNPKFYSFDDEYSRGCPYGVDEKIFNLVCILKLELFIYKINNNLDQTIAIFNKIMPRITVL